jgi:hypothetical protein
LTIFQVLILFVIFTSIIFLIWSVYPLPLERRILRVPGIGQLNLTWPSQIRKGDVGSLRLEFDSAELGIGGIDVIDNETSKFGVIHQLSFSSSDHTLVETRLELPGLQIGPGEELIQPIRIGEKITFNWQIKSDESGEIDGELWIYLKTLSESGGEVHRLPISVLNFKLQFIDLFGMTRRMTRIIGIIGISFALIMWRDIIGGYARRLLNWSGII